MSPPLALLPEYVGNTAEGLRSSMLQGSASELSCDSVAVVLPRSQLINVQ